MEVENAQEAQQEQWPMIPVSDQQNRSDRDTVGRIDYWELLSELRIG